MSEQGIDPHRLPAIYRTRIVGARVVRVTREIERAIACPACKGESYCEEGRPYLCGECYGAGQVALVETLIEVEPTE